MDMTEPPYSEARFQQIMEEVSDVLKKVGYKIPLVAFVPISGWHGDNVVEESENMPWYKGWSVVKPDNRRVTGKTLKEALN